MDTRCDHCGYQNSLDYRFCGMCGAPLSVPVAVESTQQNRIASRSVLPVQPATQEAPHSVPPQPADVQYLLDEADPPSSHWRMYLALVLLIACGFLIWARWQRSGYPWAKQAAPSEAVPTQQSANESNPPAATKSDSNPSAQSPEPKSEVPAPANAPQEQAPKQSEFAAPVPTGQPQADSTAAPVAKPSQDQPPALPKLAERKSPPRPDSPKPARRTAAPPAPSSPSPSRADQLLADGEKYLYGSGVPQNCSRALKNLQTAARSDARAKSLLGAMYASGNCVDRDVPTAYRWFAMALRADPGNARYQRNVEVLWRQMDADQRQRAISSAAPAEQSSADRNP